jgi:hypothetical protein
MFSALGRVCHQLATTYQQRCCRSRQLQQLLLVAAKAPDDILSWLKAEVGL